MTTIKDVAFRAGVSQSTAARVAGNYGYVSQKNRQKVLEAIQDLGYRPNRIARSMVTQSTQTVGLVLTDIQNPFFAELARGVEDVTWQYGYALILANTDENLQRESAILTMMHEKLVDGLILVPASSRSSPTRTSLFTQGMPMVLLDRASQGLEVDTVLVDNKQGACQAVSYLIELGHTRIGIITDHLDITTNEERLAGYRAALETFNIPLADDLIRICQYSHQSAFDVARELLARPDPPTAFFTTNNLISIGALEAIQEAGLRVPEDISMIGFDELDWGKLNFTHFTTVSQPAYDMGKAAAERLIARLEGDESAAREIRFRTQFILRSSSGPCPIPIPLSAS